MNHITRAAMLASVVLGISLGGCASTDNGQPIYPTLKVLNDTPYEWDNSKSEALNVARMTLPAGAGYGLSDAKDGKTVIVEGKSSTAENVGGAVIMGLASGIYGVVSDALITNEMDALLNWKPTVVLHVPTEALEVNGKIDFLRVRDAVSDKVVDAVKQAFPDINITGLYTSKSAYKYDQYNELIVVIEGDICVDARHFHMPDEDVRKMDLSKLYIGAPPQEIEFCSINFEISIPHRLGDNYVVAAVMEYGYYFMKAIEDNIDAYVLVPDVYQVDRTYNISVTFPYAYVKKSGKELLFQKP